MIYATFENIASGYKFDQVYQSRRGFLSAVSKGKKDKLVNALVALEGKKPIIIHNMKEFNQYKKMKD
jgi:hypothetical protein